MTPEEISKHLILQVRVGSRLHGTNVDGQDDEDLMGICVEPPQTTIGLGHFDHYEFRTQPTGVRSGPGDVDSIIYSLRKYLRLASAGNPTVLLPLFAPSEHILVDTEWGQRLRALAPHFVSAQAGRRFLGYLDRQIAGVEGRLSTNTRRPELIEAHGYDTKFAAHALRLAFQGVEFLTTGRLELPMAPDKLDLVMQIRTGTATKAKALIWISQERGKLIATLRDTQLPQYPSMEEINHFAIDTHLHYWHGRFM